MSKLAKRTKNFFKRLHEDESGPNTVEWVLLVIVALIIMAAIYFIAQWVLQGGAEEADKVNQGRDAATKDVDGIKTDLGIK
jgi:Flp pilus assembly pilin Flp